jgi:hypothetical protein
VNAITPASAAVLAGVLIGLSATTPYAADRFFVAREGEGVGVSSPRVRKGDRMTTWKAFATTAIGVGLLMQGAMSGQQKAASAKPMTLTTMDYIEIRQLASR